jgi:hypothetical protein
MPHGTIWSENSCAYDSVVTILYSIWSRDVVNETVRLQSLRYAILNKVVASFTEHQLHHCSLEDSRDSIRQQLMAKAPNSFPWGAYIGIDAVFEQLLQTPHAILTSERICKQGHNVQRRVSIVNNCVFNVHGYTGSTQYWMSRLETQTGSRCRVCANSLVRKFHLSAKPPLFVMSVAGSSAHPSLVVQVRIHDEVAIYNLCGITYFGNGHYVSRLLTPQAEVWYHDGIETGRDMVLEAPLPQCDLRVCRGKLPVTYVYILQ